MQVGWIGLGAMGAPMAARLARCGHSVHGFDIAADRAAALAADGVRGVATIAAAVGGADVVAIMVAARRRPSCSTTGAPGWSRASSGGTQRAGHLRERHGPGGRGG